MSITAVGKINMQNAICAHCGALITTWRWNQEDTLTCAECGAVYRKGISELKVDEVFVTYDFVEFRCLCKLPSPCSNVCPTGGMFCREHVSDEEFKKANDGKKYHQDRIAEVDKVLSRMQESKKVWIITQIGGINEG
jgi:hypothetical protein